MLEATRRGEGDARTALETLCRAYWYPLHAYLRRRGCSPDDALDLTQAFFLHIIDGDLLARADAERGRFRSYLLTALQHFMAKEHRRAQAQKRGGGAVTVSIDAGDAEERFALEPADLRTPEAQYERSWALALLERGFARLSEDYAKAGRAVLFEALRPYLAGKSGLAGYEALGATLGMGVSAVTVAIHRMRRRYGERLREEIAQTVFDTVSGLRVASSVQHLYSPVALLASPDGIRTLSFGRAGRACVWDADSGRLLLSPISLDTEKVSAVDFSHDGTRVLLFPRGARNGPDGVSVWRSAQMRPPLRHAVTGQRDFNHARLSPDEKLGCLGLWDSPRAHVYELASGRVVLDAPAGGHIYVHLFSPDMRRYYALTANGWVHGWSLETGAPLWTPQRQSGGVRSGAVSPDGTQIVAAFTDGHIRIFDATSGAVVRTLDHPGEVKTIRLAPDGSGRFLSGATDGVAHLWDLATGEKLRTFTGHTQPIIASAWSPDSRYVATAPRASGIRSPANLRPVRCRRATPWPPCVSPTMDHACSCAITAASASGTRPAPNP